MLFNSYVFILAFLPIVISVFYIVGFLFKGKKYTLIWLSIASLFFYGFWNPPYIFLILASIIVNYFVGALMFKYRDHRKIYLICGIVFNVCLLGYFKYATFIVFNINYLFDADFSLHKIVLPLAISFFTFQQIAYLVDSYREKIIGNDFLSYITFVLFFPQLIAGPIVHHKEMMPQFLDIKHSIFNVNNFTKGVFLFSIGLFKKVIFATQLSLIAKPIFDVAFSLSPIEVFFGVLAYTLNLYFDFSGYIDMALGVGLMYNIHLPNNFNSPYKATNIREFWRRWHITLSRFLRDYIYIPLGGNRKSTFYTCLFLIITFFIGGLWHGASWNFVVWGMLHGLACVIFLLYSRLNISLPKVIGWCITFGFVSFAWIFFRAQSMERALFLIKNGFDFSNITLSQLEFLDKADFPWFLIGLVVIVCFKNSLQFLEKITWYKTVVITFMFFISLLLVYKTQEFIYFDF